MRNTQIQQATLEQDLLDTSALAPIENQNGEQTSLIAPPVILDEDFDRACTEAALSLQADYEAGKFRKIEESQTYYEFATIGQEVLGVFMKVANLYIPDELTGEIRPLPSIVWKGIDGKLYCNGGVVLVRHFYDQYSGTYLIAPGTRVLITFAGKKGKAKIYEVARLIPAYKSNAAAHAGDQNDIF